MDDLIRRLEPFVRSPQARVLAAIAAVGLYYGFVVAGEIGRTGSILLTAVPAALSLPWFRTRPLLALALSGAGILMLIAFMVNGSYVQDVTQQSAVLVAIFGGTISRERAARQAAAAAAVVVAVLGSLFALVRFAGADLGVGQGAAFAFELIVLAFLPVVLGLLARRLLERGDLLDTRVQDLTEREHAAERDVIIEQERNRVARDVHDVVAHSLAVVIAQADGARYAAEKDPATVAPALDAIAETARAALGEVRTLLHELRHTQSATPAPGTSDVDTLVDGFRVLGLTVDVAHYGHQRALGDATQLAVYRVVQEALTNALRHGDTGRPVSVDFDWGDHALAVVITSALQEDGVPQVDGPGHGIPGMRERAALAGGDFTVGVGTKGMFRVRVSVPAAVSPEATTSVLSRA